MTPFVPTEISKHVEKLEAKINSEYPPEYVPIIPEPYAIAADCYLNVEEKVKRDGGKVHYGWAVFQSDILCEAERHAVWESPDEDLIDITPRAIQFAEILFISDNDFVYRGQLVDNIRINITKNKLVDDFITICETLEYMYTFGRRVGTAALMIPEPAQTYVAQYEQAKSVYHAYLSTGNTPESLCYCGGPRKYKNCCGEKIKKGVAKDLSTVNRELKERPLKP